MFFANGWSGLCLALVFLSSSILIRLESISALIAEDHAIESGSTLAFIAIIRVGLFLIGIGLLVWPRTPAKFRWFRSLLWGLGLGICGLGAAGWAQWLEVLPPTQLNDLTKLPEFAARYPRVGLGSIRADRLTERVNKLSPKKQASQKGVELRTSLAEALLRQGKIAEAIAELESCRETAHAANFPKAQISGICRALGVAHLRDGETSHCLRMCNGDSCILPLGPQGVWSNTAPAVAAAACFAECLEVDPTDQRARWMLNLAQLLAGNYPQGVPEGLTVKTSLFEFSDLVPRFTNVAAGLGVDQFDLLGGAIMDDFDNDGFLDLVSSSYEPNVGLTFFRNEQDGTFSDQSKASGLDEQWGGFNIVHADYDNDGRLDIFVMRGAWMRTYGRIRNSLLHQEPDGRFLDVTESSGIGGRAYPTLSAAWADYDLDGDVDLYVGNEILAPGKSSPSQLFQNNGDGTFTDVSKKAGVTNDRNAKSITWGDYDNDGDPDLFVANHTHLNRLYRNNGDGTFTDVAEELGVDLHEPDNSSFTSWFWDLNNDGWLDIFVGPNGWSTRVDAAAHEYLGQPPSSETMMIFLNDKQGGFRNATDELGMGIVKAVMGANYGDIDNDGFLDFYLGTGNPPFDYLVPNVLYRNQQGKGFQDVTSSAGVGHLQKGHGVAFGDLDRDGDQDIFAQLGGFYADDRFYNALFENPGNDNQWIVLQLIGTRSNRCAIGARIKIVADTPTGELTVHRVVGSGGGFGASSFQQEIGLGSASRITAIEVTWPTSEAGGAQRFLEVGVNQCLVITEGEADYRAISYEPRKLNAPTP